MRDRKIRWGAALPLALAAALAPLVLPAAIFPARAQTAQPAPLAPPSAGLARVWFLRQYQPSENLSTPMIFVNGAPMTPSLPGTIFYRDFPPGTYTFSVDTCGHDINQFPTVQLAPGAQYEFEVQSLQSFTPPDCPWDSGTFYVRSVQPRFLQLYLPQLAYLGPR